MRWKFSTSITPRGSHSTKSRSPDEAQRNPGPPPRIPLTLHAGYEAGYRPLSTGLPSPFCAVRLECGVGNARGGPRGPRPSKGGFMRKRAAVLCLALACAAMAAAAPPAVADGAVSKLRKPGGQSAGMGAKPGEREFFDAVVAQYNASGERFRIDGHCQSMCTIFLSIKNVCVTPGARLLFHAGGDRRTGRTSAGSTNHMLSAYNSALRQYVTENRYMETFDFHTISGRDIIGKFGYPACK